MYINTETRNKEIRFTEVGDLDTRFWTFDIIHVKEEASCGLPRRIPHRGSPSDLHRLSPATPEVVEGQYSGFTSALPSKNPMTGSCTILS